MVLFYLTKRILQRLGFATAPEVKAEKEKELLLAYAEKLRIVQERKKMLHEIADDARAKLDKLKAQRTEMEQKREALLDEVDHLPPAEPEFQTSVHSYLDSEYPSMLEEIDYMIGMQESNIERFEMEITSVKEIEAEIEAVLKDHEETTHPA
jgi:DNA repair exonuclease SbcCD ATPase subunit